MNDKYRIDSPLVRIKKLLMGMITDKWWWFWVIVGAIVGQLIARL